MQAQREAPPDMQCKDKFLVQSVILPDDIEDKEVSQEFVSSHNFSLFWHVNDVLDAYWILCIGKVVYQSSWKRSLWN